MTRYLTMTSGDKRYRIALKPAYSKALNTPLKVQNALYFVADKQTPAVKADLLNKLGAGNFFEVLEYFGWLAYHKLLPEKTK